ncbi:hypothetical protein [Psychrobacillus sp. BM2]|uniref:hypothetical protein n=1 Tax=Psychrobacillus sp. BM2 TaxID=3400421 RepID=UPI003B01E157
MFGNLFKKKDPIEKFWQYFIDHEKELYNFRDEDIENLFGDLYRLISKVNNQLVFSVPKPLIDGKREFTISGSRIAKNFPDVKRLVEGAPEMDNFTIVAFNQRNDDEHGTSTNDIEITRDDIFFDYTYEQEQNELFVSLYIKGFKEENDDYYAVVLDLLELVIGEYALATEITEVEFNMLNTKYDLLPINDLPKILEDIKKGTRL